MYKNVYINFVMLHWSHTFPRMASVFNLFFCAFWVKSKSEILIVSFVWFFNMDDANMVLLLPHS